MGSGAAALPMQNLFFFFLLFVSDTDEIQLLTSNLYWDSLNAHPENNDLT